VLSPSCLQMLFACRTCCCTSSRYTLAHPAPRTHPAALLLPLPRGLGGLLGCGGAEDTNTKPGAAGVLLDSSSPPLAPAGPREPQRLLGLVLADLAVTLPGRGGGTFSPASHDEQLCSMTGPAVCGRVVALLTASPGQMPLLPPRILLPQPPTARLAATAGDGSCTACAMGIHLGILSAMGESSHAGPARLLCCCHCRCGS
jgi:hypothetical protein